jgi:hypothetical protein
MKKVDWARTTFKSAALFLIISSFIVLGLIISELIEDNSLRDMIINVFGCFTVIYLIIFTVMFSILIIKEEILERRKG